MGVQLPSKPITRKEKYLAKAAGQAVEVPAEPITREEAYLDAIAKGSGGGGGGTTNYENLSNQPQVNGETLIGDKTGADLGLVDAVEGKDLSTNDYDDNEKAAVAAATSAISAMKDGTDLDSFGDVEVALLDKADTADLGTAAAKDSTNAVTAGSTDLVESGAVKDAIDVAVAAAYHHAGTKTVAQLTHDLLVAANEGNVYNITDSGTTTSDFIEGIGKTIDEGSNVGICKVGNTYMFDLLSGFVDTTNFVQKSVTAGLLKNDGTVNDEIEGDVATLKSGLTNLMNDVKLNTQDLTTPSRTKNLLPLTIERIKALNTSGSTWSGNSVTMVGVTYTFDVDGNGSITKIHADGTATGGDAWLTLYKEDTDFGDCVLTGCPSGGSEHSYNLTAFRRNPSFKWYYDNGSGVSIPSGETIEQVYINVLSGYALPTGGIDFYPMIRPAGTTPDFAPYIPSVDARLDAVENGLTNVKNSISPVENSIYTGDLNDIIDTCNIITTGINCPVAGIFNLHTMRTMYNTSPNDIVATQIAVSIYGDYKGHVYIRTFWNTWEPWREITTSVLT